MGRYPIDWMVSIMSRQFSLHKYRGDEFSVDFWPLFIFLYTTQAYYFYWHGWLLPQPVNQRRQPVTFRLSWTCIGLASIVFSRKMYFLGIDKFLNWKVFHFKLRFYAHYLEALSLTSYFYPKYFCRGCVQKQKFLEGDFLLKDGDFYRSRELRQLKALTARAHFTNMV